MSPRRKFILVPMGTSGDVAPFAWLAAALRDADHDVVAAVQSPFVEFFSEVGVRAVPYGSSEEHEAVIRHPDLWDPRRGFALIARMSERWNRQALPVIRLEVAPQATTIVAAGLAFAGRITAETLQLPFVTVHLQPFAFLSLANPPVLRAGWEWFTRCPRWLRRPVYRLVHWKVDWLLSEPLNTLRAECGLPVPIRRVMRDYWMSPQRVIGLFPEWYAPRAPDWPPQAITTRFPLHDGPSSQSLHPEVEEFLHEGPPPILFTPGSANTQASRFFQVAVQTAQHLACRALFVTPFPHQVPSDLPRTVRHFRRAPFSRLFPRCRAVVHHGGIGTVARGLASGVPQLAIPMSHDQPDNAARLRHLGVGDYLYPRQCTPEALASRLRLLLGSKDIGRACRDIRERVRHQIPAGEVVRLISEVV